MWRFVQVSDPHLASERDGMWNNGFLCTMMPEVMACLRKDLAKIKPDFILATGDIVSRQTRDAMFAARDLMDSLGFPYYPLGGNHDFVVDQSRNWFLEAFARHLPILDTVYSFDHKNLHFCVLDPWWMWSDGALCPVSEKAVAKELDISLKGARWGLPPHQFAWLESDLGANEDKHTIIAVHFPLLPIPERLRRPELKDGGHLENGEMLLELLEGFPQVKAVFSGHVHMHFIEHTGSLCHVVTGSLPEYPVEYRDVSVYDDRLEIVTLGLSDSTFAARSLIPNHEWTSGQAQDRSVTIHLT